MQLCNLPETNAPLSLMGITYPVASLINRGKGFRCAATSNMSEWLVCPHNSWNWSPTEALTEDLALQSLINSRPEATTALLMQLCTDMGDFSKADSDWVAKIGDFAHLYTDRCSLITHPLNAELPQTRPYFASSGCRSSYKSSRR